MGCQVSYEEKIVKLYPPEVGGICLLKLIFFYGLMDLEESNVYYVLGFRFSEFKMLLNKLQSS